MNIRDSQPEKVTLFCHNCTRLNKQIVQNLLAESPTFVFLQETWHFPGAKNIYDKTGQYLTFQKSDMDKNSPRLVRKGGLITYIRSVVSVPTSLYRAEPRYLITITGNVVAINVYMPQQGLFDSGEYQRILQELASAIESLGPAYAYILGGDFNTFGRNKPLFQNFVKNKN